MHASASSMIAWCVGSRPSARALTAMARTEPFGCAARATDQRLPSGSDRSARSWACS
ncbi:hypothetical protein [Saccharothrix texasensis]|uniref:hypothetical protein n=1 Tax=Saccharothrix texasensis TaxID=103734 RepID=UPI001476A452|nr:hypothetical protein [Saccharothrix texasensis]